MKRRCCQSSPRCSGCPVLRKRTAMAPGSTSAASGVIVDVLRARPERAYPPSVLAALQELDAARERRAPTGRALDAA